MSELKEPNRVDAPRVRVGLGYTKNMGNYETLRIDLSVEDSARHGEKVSETFDRVFAFVESKLIQKVSEVDEELKS
jgi:hypothetical protein